MSIEVHIKHDGLMQRLDVYLVERLGDTGYCIYDADGRPGPTRQPNATNEDAKPTFCVPTGAAHALLAALARQLGAVEHPEQLRRDFEHERGRVDRLIAYLTERPA